MCDVQWSPSHPAVFSTITSGGCLALWNLRYKVPSIHLLILLLSCSKFGGLSTFSISLLLFVCLFAFCGYALVYLIHLTFTLLFLFHLLCFPPFTFCSPFSSSFYPNLLSTPLSPIQSPPPSSPLLSLLSPLQSPLPSHFLSSNPSSHLSNLQSPPPSSPPLFPL